MMTVLTFPAPFPWYPIRLSLYGSPGNFFLNFVNSALILKGAHDQSAGKHASHHAVMAPVSMIMTPVSRPMLENGWMIMTLISRSMVENGWVYMMENISRSMLENWLVYMIMTFLDFC